MAPVTEWPRRRHGTTVLLLGSLLGWDVVLVTQFTRVCVVRAGVWRATGLLRGGVEWDRAHRRACIGDRGEALVPLYNDPGNDNDIVMHPPVQ